MVNGPYYDLEIACSPDFYVICSYRRNFVSYASRSCVTMPSFWQQRKKTRIRFALSKIPGRYCWLNGIKSTQIGSSKILAAYSSNVNCFWSSLLRSGLSFTVHSFSQSNNFSSPLRWTSSCTSSCHNDRSISQIFVPIPFRYCVFYSVLYLSSRPLLFRNAPADQ